jgi:hypothetical protein
MGKFARGPVGVGVSVPRRFLWRTMTVTRIQLFRWLLALSAVAALFGSANAHAGDRVVWKKTTLSENLESWRVDLEFHFGRAPDIAHVPIQFDFTQVVYYENTIEDGQSQPRVLRQPVDNKQPMVITQDVSFLDPSSAKTVPRTRFNFKLTRELGFEAGEYKVSVRDKRSGNKLPGGETTLTLNGTNKLVDRRSITFDEKKPQKKEEDKPKWQEEYDPNKDPNREEYWEGGPQEKESTDDDIPPPAHMQDNPGACGCRIPGAANAGSGAGWLALGFGVAACGLRRRSRSRKADAVTSA